MNHNLGMNHNVSYNDNCVSAQNASQKYLAEPVPVLQQLRLTDQIQSAHGALDRLSALATDLEKRLATVLEGVPAGVGADDQMQQCKSSLPPALEEMDRLINRIHLAAEQIERTYLRVRV